METPIFTWRGAHKIAAASRYMIWIALIAPALPRPVSMKLNPAVNRVPQNSEAMQRM